MDAVVNAVTGTAARTGVACLEASAGLVVDASTTGVASERRPVTDDSQPICGSLSISLVNITTAAELLQQAHTLGLVLLAFFCR